MKNLSRFSRLAAIMLPAMLIFLTCCRPDGKAAVDRMVNELNSPQFKAREVATGLFTGSNAEVKNDTLSITFHCAPAVSLAGITPDMLPALHSSSVKEFRESLSQPEMREGIETLRDNRMILLMVWKDSEGNTVSLPVNPSEILD